MSNNVQINEGNNSQQIETNKMSDNAILGYIKNIWDKFKIVIFIVFSIIIIAFIELSIATNVSECVYTLHRGKINILQPSCLKLRDNDYIYIFKSTEFMKQKVFDKINIPAHYLFKDINEHLATQITKPAHSIKQTFKNFNNSATPINDLSDNIINIAKINNIVHPFNAFNSLSSKWIMLYPSYLNPKCFINKQHGKAHIYFN